MFVKKKKKKIVDNKINGSRLFTVCSSVGYSPDMIGWRLPKQVNQSVFVLHYDWLLE